MNPTREINVTFSDLLDRLLDKGLVLNLDLIIGVADLPLIGINLRAAIASVETMIAYGIFSDWDEATRQSSQGSRTTRKVCEAGALNPVTCLQGRFIMPGSHWYSDGIYRAWRCGTFYLSDQELILWRQDPAETLWKAALVEIRAWSLEKQACFTGSRKEVIFVSLEDGRNGLLATEDPGRLLEELNTAREAAGLPRLANCADPSVRAESVTAYPGSLLPLGKGLRKEGKIWYRMPGIGLHGPTWKPGCLVLRDDSILWEDVENFFHLELNRNQVIDHELRTLAVGLDPDTPVLAITYNHQGEPSGSLSGSVKEALFNAPAEELANWIAVLKAWRGP